MHPVQLNIFIPMYLFLKDKIQHSSAGSNYDHSTIQSLEDKSLSFTHIKLTVFSSMKGPDACYAGKLRLKEERKGSGRG